MNLNYKFLPTECREGTARACRDGTAPRILFYITMHLQNKRHVVEYIYTVMLVASSLSTAELASGAEGEGSPPRNARGISAEHTI